MTKKPLKPLEINEKQLKDKPNKSIFFHRHRNRKERTAKKP